MDNIGMGKVQWYALVTVFLIGILAWDNWQVRQELVQLQNAKTLQSAVVLPTPVSEKECPVITPISHTQLALPTAPAVNGAVATSTQNTSGTVQIPPGLNLLEAIKFIQSEQAKTQPGSAGVNPFGTSQ